MGEGKDRGMAVQVLRVDGFFEKKIRKKNLKKKFFELISILPKIELPDSPVDETNLPQPAPAAPAAATNANLSNPAKKSAGKKTRQPLKSKTLTLI